MDITVALAFSEQDAVSLLNWLAQVNARILHENPGLPGVYQSGGASSPTSQIKIQTSPDNVNWVDNVESTQLTATGDKAETKSHATLPILRYVRAVTTLGGGTNPNHTSEVRIISNGPFRLKSVS